MKAPKWLLCLCYVLTKTHPVHTYTNDRDGSERERRKEEGGKEPPKSRGNFLPTSPFLKVASSQISFKADHVSVFLRRNDVIRIWMKESGNWNRGNRSISCSTTLLEASSIQIVSSLLYILMVKKREESRERLLFLRSEWVSTPLWLCPRKATKLEKQSE